MLKPGGSLIFSRFLGKLSDFRRVLGNGLERQIRSGGAEILQAVEIFLRQRGAGQKYMSRAEGSRPESLIQA